MALKISTLETEQQAYYILYSLIIFEGEGAVTKWIYQNYRMHRGIAKSFFYNTTCSMYEAYSKPKHAGITVYSVKIDAFTIKAEDEQSPR